MLSLLPSWTLPKSNLAQHAERASHPQCAAQLVHPCPASLAPSHPLTTTWPAALPHLDALTWPSHGAQSRTDSLATASAVPLGVCEHSSRGGPSMAVPYALSAKPYGTGAICTGFPRGLSTCEGVSSFAHSSPLLHCPIGCPSVTLWEQGEGGGTAPRSAVAAKRSQREARGTRRGSPLYIAVQADGSDSWRLQVVIDMLRDGAVGIIPTDTYPALVCDVDARNAVERLYKAKGISANKPLSILCRNFADVNTYTSGFPVTAGSGREDTFRVARRALPGPYTLILHASKALPKQCVDFLSGKVKSRRTVGVRLPGDPICQAILQQLDRPLLCTSVTGLAGEAEVAVEVEDAAVIMDQYAGRGIDFVVDAGIKVVKGSTVIDMTGADPVLLRHGKGDPTVFMPELVPT